MMTMCIGGFRPPSVHAQQGSDQQRFEQEQELEGRRLWVDLLKDLLDQRVG